MLPGIPTGREAGGRSALRGRSPRLGTDGFWQRDQAMRDPLTPARGPARPPPIPLPRVLFAKKTSKYLRGLLRPLAARFPQGEGRAPTEKAFSGHSSRSATRNRQRDPQYSPQRQKAGYGQRGAPQAFTPLTPPSRRGAFVYCKRSAAAGPSEATPGQCARWTQVMGRVLRVEPPSQASSSPVPAASEGVVGGAPGA
jgi:hypothetical protein